jgi:hypothetical protein
MVVSGKCGRDFNFFVRTSALLSPWRESGLERGADLKSDRQPVVPSAFSRTTLITYLLASFLEAIIIIVVIITCKAVI